MLEKGQSALVEPARSVTVIIISSRPLPSCDIGPKLLISYPEARYLAGSICRGCEGFKYQGSIYLCLKLYMSDPGFGVSARCFRALAESLGRHKWRNHIHRSVPASLLKKTMGIPGLGKLEGISRQIRLAKEESLPHTPPHGSVDICC